MYHRNLVASVCPTAAIPAEEADEWLDELIDLLYERDAAACDGMVVGSHFVVTRPGFVRANVNVICVSDLISQQRFTRMVLRATEDASCEAVDQVAVRFYDEWLVDGD